MNNIFLISVLLFLQFTSCKDDFPKSEKDCIKEAKSMLEFTCKADYENLFKNLKKYEMYQNYDLAQTERVYKKLHDYMQDKSVGKMKYIIQRDTLGIESQKWSNVAFLEIHFFNDTVSNMNKKSSFCMFSYSLGIDEKHYSLQQFWDNFEKKLPLPVLSAPPAPNPVAPK